MKKILFYNGNEEELAVLRLVAKEMGIKTVRITDNCALRTLDILFLLDEDEEGTSIGYEDAYMIMQDLTKEDLMDFLRRTKEKGLEFEGIKIMRTENNASWLLKDVFLETKSEHETMKRVFVLQQIMKSCNEIDLSAVEEDSKSEFANALMDAYMLLQMGEYDAAQVEAASARLMEAMRKIRKVSH